MLKRGYTIAGIILLLVMVFTVGCSNKSNTQPTNEVKQSNEVAEPRVIIDQQGNEVVLPEKIERIVVSTIWPIPSVYSLFMGTAEGLVGINEGSKSAAEFSILPRVAPQIMEAETSFVKGTEVNIEELLKLKPDIVIYRGENVGEREIYEKAGLTAIAFNTTAAAAGNTVETVASWLKLLGEIFDKEDRAQEIVDYANQKQAIIDERVKDLDDSERVRGLFLFRYNEGQITVAGKGHFGHYWLESAGAINVAAEVQGAVDVNMEQIYSWNPDKIFITNFSQHMPEDLYTNAVGNHDWSSVKAVNKKQVYKVPLGMYRWYPPSSDTPLMLQWMAKQVYPELFEDLDIEKETKEYFQRFYNVDLSEEDLHMIFNPAREAAY